MPLFDRTTNSVTPTRYGETLLSKAEAIISDAIELQREIDLMRGLELGSLDVAMGIYPAEFSGNRALGEMLRNYPNLCYRAFVSNWETVIERVLSREVDLGYATVEAAEIDERLTIEQVCNPEMVLYCRKGHPLVDYKEVTRSDLAPFPLVSIRVPSALADAIPGKAKIDPVTGDLMPAMEIDDFATARSIVSNSDGIGAAVPTQVQDQLVSGEFKLLKYQRPWLKPVFGFILLKNRAISAAADVFMEEVIALEKEASRRNQALMEEYLG